jgi:c-di-GMP-binding flagellar brake protein YcgR
MPKPNEQDALPSDPRGETAARKPGAPSREDLRKHLRFQIDDASTSFSIKGVSTSVGSGRVSRGRAAINLSEGGAMLLVCETLPVGTPIIVRIEMDGQEDFIEAKAVVRWCEQGGRNEKDFHAGIQFDALSDADLRKIDRMREWVTSPEYKSRRGTQVRE